MPRCRHPSAERAPEGVTLTGTVRLSRTHAGAITEHGTTPVRKGVSILPPVARLLAKNGSPFCQLPLQYAAVMPRGAQAAQQSAARPHASPLSKTRRNERLGGGGLERSSSLDQPTAQ